MGGGGAVGYQGRQAGGGGTLEGWAESTQDGDSDIELLGEDWGALTHFYHLQVSGFWSARAT